MKDLVLKFIKRHFFTSLVVLGLAVLLVRVIDLGEIYKVTDYTNKLAEVTMLLTCVASGSFMFDYIFECYDIKALDKINSNKMISNLVACVLAAIIYLIIRAIPNPDMKEGSIAVFNVSVIYGGLACFFIMKKKQMHIKEYSAKVLMNNLGLFLFECILVAGIGILFYIYYVLFKNVDWAVFFKIFVFQATLMMIGTFIAMENVEGKLTLFTKVLIKYVMFIMVLIGFAFFYIYLIGIIVKREIPSNQVFSVCTILFAGGLSTSLMSRNFDDDTPYDKVIEYLPVAFIPALILQIISIMLRVGQYGFTTTRYIGIIIIIAEIAYIAIYLFKYEKLNFILIVEVILVLVMSYVPLINAYQFPEIYNTMFNVKNGDTSSEHFNTSFDDEEVVKLYLYNSIDEYDVAGYSKLKSSQIHIEYDKDIKGWKYYHKTSEMVEDFTKVNIEDSKSNAFDTINIKQFMEETKQSIIKNDYTNDVSVIFKDVNTDIVDDDKKFMMNDITMYYDRQLEDFTIIIINGYLLTK